MADKDEPFVIYKMANGDLIWGDYEWVTELEFFEDRDEEVVLVKRTYQLLSEEEITLPNPYQSDEDDDADD